MGPEIAGRSAMPAAERSGEMEKRMITRSTQTGRRRRPTVLGLALTLMPASAAAPVVAAINLELRPPQQTVWYLAPDVNVEVGLYIVSDDETDQFTTAVQAIIQWDPAYLEMLGAHSLGAVPLQGWGFPSPDPFGLNESDVPTDGDGMFVVFAPLGDPAAATPSGALVGTFVFRPLQYSPGTPVDIPPTAGDPPGDTIIFDGEVGGLDVTGTLSGAVIEIVPCCPPDLDYDCVVGVNDFLILLAEWGTDPAGPPDLDGDGDVDVTDFLLLLAAWGPCPE
jgi:hypothetical protein